MKVAFCFIFLAVHVSGFGILVPFPVQPQQFLNQNAIPQQMMPPQMVQNTGPIAYENQGIDQNGNPFYENEVIQSMTAQGVDPSVIAQQLSQMQQLQTGANVFNGLLRQQRQQRQQQTEQVQVQQPPMMISPIENMLEGIMTGLMQAQLGGFQQYGDLHQNYQQPGLHFNVPEPEMVANDQEPELVNNILDVQKLMDSNLEDEQKEHQQQQESLHRDFATNLINQLQAKPTGFEFLTPESAEYFEKNVRPHEVPVKGQFHLRQAKYEHEANLGEELDDLYRQFRTDEARKVEHEKFDFVLGPLVDEHGVEMLENDGNVPLPIISEITNMLNGVEQSLRGDEDDVPEIELEKYVDAREKKFLRVAKAEAIKDNSLNGWEKKPNSMYIKLGQKITESEVARLVDSIARIAQIRVDDLKEVDASNDLVTLRPENIEPEKLCTIIRTFHQAVFEENGLKLVACVVGIPHKKLDHNKVLFIVTVIVCIGALCVLIGLLCVFSIKRRHYLRQKLIENVSSLKPNKQKFDDVEKLVPEEASNKRCFLKDRVWPFMTRQVSTQQADLCRSANLSPLSNTQTTDLTNRTENFESTPVVVDERKGASTRSSASSWSDEPVSNANIDITTGHAILSYMEDHLNDKSRLDLEWIDLCGYEADQNNTQIGTDENNMAKNRYSNILPYDHNRVKLQMLKESDSDYINASYVVDDDPKNPAYIATQGPLGHTTSDFWKMVWEQNSVVIVSLCRTVEYGSSKCNQYWPTNGFETYGDYEVHLVSEHVWCEDYLVRSFYLMNKGINQTRTVTQFQFLTWPENSMPPNIKSILDFRRKVNKSYNKKSFPIIVHCNDGIGRTGTYIMIDMILKKIAKEAKEIDLAATLEYLRDQRKDMIKNKNQFEFSFAVITEEVQNMLKTVIQ